MDRRLCHCNMLRMHSLRGEEDSARFYRETHDTELLSLDFGVSMSCDVDPEVGGFRVGGK